MLTEEKIINSIKEKKSLSGISNTVVRSELSRFLKENDIKLSKLTDKDAKIVISDLRKKLRRLTGSFQYSQKSQGDILSQHASTNERSDFYPILKDKISLLDPKSILDLGCGINPIAIATNNAYYYAYDINEKDLAIVKGFFERNNIQGEVKVRDLRDPNAKFPSVDLCLMFKLLDILDQKDHRISESLIRKIQARYFLISFSTKTLSGAPMRHPQRGWIERLLTRLGFKFESFSSKNEIFYLAHR